MTVGFQIEYTTAGYLNGGTISPGPILLTQVGGFNPTAVDLYVLLFEQLVPIPANTVPVQSFKVPVGASFSWEPPRGGKVLSGLSFGVSSTGNLYTALAQAIWLYAEGMQTA